MPLTPLDKPGRRRFLQLSAGLLPVVALAGCGFHLRGPRPLPFKTIFLGLGEYSDLHAALKRQIAVTGTTQVVDEAKDAEVSLQVLRDTRTREILSLNAAGKVSEYRLYRTFAFRLVKQGGGEAIPPTELILKRDMTYDDSNALAKEQEADQLYKDMLTDLVQQLLRRLAAAKMS